MIENGMAQACAFDNKRITIKTREQVTPIDRWLLIFLRSDSAMVSPWMGVNMVCTSCSMDVRVVKSSK